MSPADVAAYVLGAPEQPWGDYGDLLWHGMSQHLSHVDSLLQLERTGPFVPQLTLPGIGDVVVRDELKRHLVSAGFTGLSFRPVTVARAVELRWEEWDRGAHDPREYPESGEPEGYILERPHVPGLVDEIGPLWQLAANAHAVLQASPAGPAFERRDSVSFSLAVEPNAPDWFRADGYPGYMFVSSRVRAWLESTVPECVRLVPVSPLS